MAIKHSGSAVHRVSLVIVALFLLLMGCATDADDGQQEDESGGTPQVLPTNTSAPIPTVPPANATPTPSPMSVPTDAPPATASPGTELPPTPTETPAAVVPEGQLSLDGPWLIVQADLSPLDGGLSAPPYNYGLWAVDHNGQSKVRLSDRRVVQMAIGPDGRYLAFVAADVDRLHNLTLMVVELPQAVVKLSMALTSVQTEPDPDAVMGNPNMEIARAISEEKNLAWSPDGRRLAFMGAHAGSSSDLYVYDLDSEAVTQLTDGPSQGILPLWTPDGRAVVHAGIETRGTGAGATMSGVWIAPADGSPVRSLYEPVNDSGGEYWLGWASESELIAYTWAFGEGYRHLRLVDINTGQEQTLWAERMPRFAFDPASKTVLLQASVPEGELVLVNTLTREARPLTVADVYDMAWSPESQAFQLLTNDSQLVTVTLTGEVISQAVTMDRLPAVSSTGTTAWHNSGGLFIQPAGENTGRRIFMGQVRYLLWSPSGDVLFFLAELGGPAPGQSTLLVAEGPAFEQTLPVFESARIEDLAWAIPTPKE